MRKAYRLNKSGKIVHTFRSTTIAPDGREEHLTRAEVGRAGQVFEDLPPHMIDMIEADDSDDWEIVELPDLVVEVEADQATSPEDSSEFVGVSGNEEEITSPTQPDPAPAPQPTIEEVSPETAPKRRSSRTRAGTEE